MSEDRRSQSSKRTLSEDAKVRQFVPLSRLSDFETVSRDNDQQRSSSGLVLTETQSKEKPVSNFKAFILERRRRRNPGQAVSEIQLKCEKLTSSYRDYYDNEELLNKVASIYARTQSQIAGQECNISDELSVTLDEFNSSLYMHADKVLHMEQIMPMLEPNLEHLNELKETSPKNDAVDEDLMNHILRNNLSSRATIKFMHYFFMIYLNEINKKSINVTTTMKKFHERSKYTEFKILMMNCLTEVLLKDVHFPWILVWLDFLARESNEMEYNVALDDMRSADSNQESIIKLMYEFLFMMSHISTYPSKEPEFRKCTLLMLAVAYSNVTLFFDTPYLDDIQRKDQIQAVLQFTSLDDAKLTIAKVDDSFTGITEIGLSPKESDELDRSLALSPDLSLMSKSLSSVHKSIIDESSGYVSPECGLFSERDGRVSKLLQNETNGIPVKQSESDICVEEIVVAVKEKRKICSAPSLLTRDVFRIRQSANTTSKSGRASGNDEAVILNNKLAPIPRIENDVFSSDVWRTTVTSTEVESLDNLVPSLCLSFEHELDIIKEPGNMNVYLVSDIFKRYMALIPLRPKASHRKYPVLSTVPSPVQRPKNLGVINLLDAPFEDLDMDELYNLWSTELELRMEPNTSLSAT